MPLEILQPLQLQTSVVFLIINVRNLRTDAKAEVLETSVEIEGVRNF